MRDLPEKLKFVTHKILPLSYDDSLSYYEAICKLVSKVNEIINEINVASGLADKKNNGGENND